MLGHATNGDLEMKLRTQRRTFTVGSIEFDAARTADGVVELWADDDDALACALGAAHAGDRMVQMIMARIVGQGRISECLADNDTTFGIDVFMRQMGFRREAAREVEELTPEARRFAEAYAAGVNHVLESGHRPLEFRLVRYRPEAWSPADTLLTVKLMSYLGLAQSQQDVEKLIIQAIHGGADVDALKRLFEPHLDTLDDEIIGHIRGLAHIEPLLPPEIRFLPGAPKVAASNNWAVAGARTASGSAIQSNDPHLEVNRLPAIWCEAVMHTPDDDRVGATMPGVPGLVMGRTRDLSFGFTYGFMDMVDFFIEDCRDDACRRGDEAHHLVVRHEIVRRKKHPDTEITIRENDLGVLEADPFSLTLADGLYLTRAWSGHRSGAAASLEILRRVPRARTVPDAQRLLRGVAISCNWVLADRQGNIGYQQSGLLPDRRHSGVHPVPAWDLQRHWCGMVAADRLHNELNPADGIIVTANNDINPPAGPMAVNLPMGVYRHDRIRDLLEARTDHTPATMAAIQLDLMSLQAEAFMEIWRPLLPDSLAGRLLATWDRRYDIDSRGATLFEEVYHELVRRICGDRLFGREAWDTIVDETAVLADYYHLFDRVLFSEDPFWWGVSGRETVLSKVFAELLNQVDPFHVMPWGRRRRVEMTNIFFDGKLPGIFGFDHGPIALPGNRATVVQGGLFTAHGRTTSFAPSWRFITDMGTDTVQTVLAGGPSGNRFSKWYTSDVERWLLGEYKTIQF
jgi:penicillin amidase